MASMIQQVPFEERSKVLPVKDVSFLSGHVQAQAICVPDFSRPALSAFYSFSMCPKVPHRFIDVLNQKNRSNIHSQ